MIELRHFRYFIAVAEDLSFRRAAERVHIDQTALSRAIRDLEEQLDASLFVRHPRNLHLTPAGLRLLKDARRLLIRFERIKRAARQTHVLYQAPLRVGIADGIAQSKLAENLNCWRIVAPEVPLELVELRARELVAALRNEEVDAGFSFGVLDDEAIAQTPAWRYRLMAVLPCNHELASRPAIALSDLLAYPLLSCNEECLPGLLAQMRAIVRKYTKRTMLAGEACTLSGYVTRIATGAGVGLGDEGHTQTLRHSGVVTLPLVEEEHITTFVLHKHQRFGIAESMQRFLTHVSTLS
ncbi:MULTISPECIES: LysR family transcriptional regulator [unclassified Variovorax]|uniref:LysR family transcriptional regulator n=1 Tax=unclassified Variovorax TaxID=663243 RepID=UPI0008AF7F39|nr:MULTISPECIES: LysR family transcriptional regulator [unclassified Variovorax]SEJ48705.1 DNA-binding transcriptional regulator, LysR family [Variovorax sp. OK202]SFC50071.1 DNA-binding transcriptional regulator, LysR family [Variovorax sp. OK212]